MKLNAGNSKVNGSPLTYFFKFFLVLFLIWTVLSGRFELKFILAGLAGSAVVSYVCTPFLSIQNQKTGKTFFLFQINLLRGAAYAAWLLKEIAKSSIDTARLVLRPKMEYSPRVVYFAADFENPIAAMILANSITLTPGTITLDVDEDGIFEVHALSEDAADGLLSGEMAAKVAWLYGETCTFHPLPEKTLIDIGTRDAKRGHEHVTKGV